MDKEFLTTPETAKYLGISLNRLYVMTSTKQIPHYKPNGKKMYFRVSELNEWILKGKVTTENELNEQVAKMLLNDKL